MSKDNLNLENLYTELGLTFRPEERILFLQDMAATAQDYKRELGSGDNESSSAEQVDEGSRQIQELMNELEEETAEFSPRLDVLPLSKKDFADRGLEVPPVVSGLMRRFDFYLLHFPITLFPKPGWGFGYLECIVEFNPGRPPAERPVAYQIFPEEEWQDVIRANQGLAMGVNENLEFKVDLERLGAELPDLSPMARAKVALKASGTAGLILGPFNYRIRRAKIQTGGRGNVKVRWRLDSEEYFEQEELRLGVVLQVPKTVSRVDIIGVLKAYRDFHLFTAHLRYLLRYVRERTRNFFEQGAPLSREGVWKDVTANI